MEEKGLAQINPQVSSLLMKPYFQMLASSQRSILPTPTEEVLSNEIPGLDQKAQKFR